MTQTCRIPLSPAQRFVLLQLSFDKGQRLQGQQGRAFRRFVRAFKLDRIRDVLAAHDNRYNPAIHNAHAPALVEITADNLDYAIKLVDVERGPVEEMVVGPLFDLLEDARADRAIAIDGVPEFDPASDDWSPRKAPPASAPDPVEAAARRIEDMLRAMGEVNAAEMVASGRWDAPAAAGEPAQAGADA